MQSNILTISCTALHLSTPPRSMPPVSRDDEPNESAMAGMHGSMTAAEQFVPLLEVRS